MTTMPRFKRGDRVRWARGQGKPVGTVIIASEVREGYGGGRASFVQLHVDGHHMWAGQAVWLGDEALELVEPASGV